MYLSRNFVILFKELHGMQKEKKINKTREHPSAVFFCFCLFLFFLFCKLLLSSLFFDWIYFSYLMYDVSRRKRKELLIFEVQSWSFNLLTRTGWSFLSECQDEQSCLQSPFLTSVMEGFLAWSFYTAAVFTI